ERRCERRHQTVNRFTCEWPARARPTAPEAGALPKANALFRLSSRLARMHVAYSNHFFPLTLTLSLREREQQASDWCLANGRWADSGLSMIEGRWTILPLPRGDFLFSVGSTDQAARGRWPLEPRKNTGPKSRQGRPKVAHGFNRGFRVDRVQ